MSGESSDLAVFPRQGFSTDSEAISRLESLGVVLTFPVKIIQDGIPPRAIAHLVLSNGDLTPVCGESGDDYSIPNAMEDLRRKVERCIREMK